VQTIIRRAGLFALGLLFGLYLATLYVFAGTVWLSS
jgi:hypothetical protein